MKLKRVDKYFVLASFILLSFTGLLLLTNHQKMAFTTSLIAYFALTFGVILSILKWKI